MLINFLERMRWKLWLAVFIILGIAYLLFFSEATSKYTEFFRGRLGEFISIFKPKPQGSFFEISLSINREALEDQSFNLPNSTLIVSGNFLTAKISEQKVLAKEGKIGRIALKDFVGKVEKRGNSFKISGNCKGFEVNDLIFSAEKSSSVEIEVIPDEISLFYLTNDRLLFSNANGELKRTVDEKTDQISLKGSTLEIDNFVGSIIISEKTLKLSGMSNFVKGDGFIFSGSV